FGVRGEPGCPGADSVGVRGAPLHRHALGGQVGMRVDLVAVLVPDLQMQVRAGGLTAVAHGRDDVARVHALSGLHVHVVDMAVDGGGAVVLQHPDPQAEAGGRTGLDHGAVADRLDGGAERVGEVDAVVH